MVPLPADNGYQLAREQLETIACADADLVLLANPNNPTGRYCDAGTLRSALATLPDTSRAWIDETYVDFVAGGASLEAFAQSRPNVVVGKSMSKAYGLSGLRLGYLAGSPSIIRPLRERRRPWPVSLPADNAAVAALASAEYYSSRYAETASLRDGLETRLAKIPGVAVVPGTANFVLCLLESDWPDAATMAHWCRRDGVFVRYFPAASPPLRQRGIRIAVRTDEENDRIAAAVGRALADARGST